MSRLKVRKGQKLSAARWNRLVMELPSKATGNAAGVITTPGLSLPAMIEPASLTASIPRGTLARIVGAKIVDHAEHVSLLDNLILEVDVVEAGDRNQNWCVVQDPLQGDDVSNVSLSGVCLALVEGFDDTAGPTANDHGRPIYLEYDRDDAVAGASLTLYDPSPLARVGNPVGRIIQVIPDVTEASGFSKLCVVLLGLQDALPSSIQVKTPAAGIAGFADADAADPTTAKIPSASCEAYYLTLDGDGDVIRAPMVDHNDDPIEYVVANALEDSIPGNRWLGASLIAGGVYLADWLDCASI